jgi:glycosyltransferase involved in cell wall biosynthesis
MLAENPIPARRRVSRPHYLARALAAQGIPVRTITYRAEPGPPLPGCRHIYLPLGFRQFDPVYRLAILGGILPLAREILRQRPAVLHGQGLLPGLVVVAASRLFGVPCVVGMPDFVEAVYSSFRFPLAGLGARLLRRLEVVVARGCSALVVESELARRIWRRRGVDPAHIHPIHHAADLERFHPGVEGEGVRRELGLEGKVIVSYHGDIGEDDGVDLLLRAFAAVAPDFPRAHLLIIGEGNPAYMVRLRELARTLPGRVTFTGWVPYRLVPRYLAASHIGVAPFRSTLYTNTVVPTKALEVMALAKALVVSHLEVFGAFLEHGRHALLVPPGEVAPLAEALRRLLARPQLRQRLGREGLALVRRHFSWERQIAQEVRLVAEVARCGRGRRIG